MQLNPAEISELIKSRIEGLSASADIRNQGTVVSVTDGIVRVHGLSDVMQGEMLEFPNNTFGLALNLVCAPLLLLPHRARYGFATRRAIRFLFDLWVRWQHATRVVAVDFIGFDRPLPPGTVVIANHPTLVDATFLLARLPDTICIFKPALMHNPAVGPAALMAGYVSGDAGIDVIHDVAARITAGHSLLIFPEGTRTAAGQTLGPVKSGFALIAARARAPTRLLLNALRSVPELVWASLLLIAAGLGLLP